MIKREKPFSNWRMYCLVFLVLFVWILWGNISIQTSIYKIRSERIPEEFDGYTIAQVSDLHNAEFGSKNRRLLSALKKTKCDILVLTGDLVDWRKTDIDIAIDFAKAAVKIAPTYYVTGNHEARMAEYSQLKSKLIEVGVIVLEDEEVFIERGDARLKLIGLQDTNFQKEGTHKKRIEKSLQKFTFGEEYTIVLAHNPILFSSYVKANADLVLAGHTHGGQFRIPFFGGLYSPSTGWFPDYDGGLYTEGNMQMLVSRGLGNSQFPVRINNRAQIVVAKLEKI